MDIHACSFVDRGRLVAKGNPYRLIAKVEFRLQIYEGEHYPIEASASLRNRDTRTRPNRAALQANGARALRAR